jgi:hypothetical protein
LCHGANALLSCDLEELTTSFSFDKDFFFYLSSDVVKRCRVGNESLIVLAMVKTLGGKNEQKGTGRLHGGSGRYQQSRS